MNTGVLKKKEIDNMSPGELVKGVVNLVSLPEVCIRINEILDDPRSAAADMGRVIGQDTGLTARLLRIVNSSFYGFPSKIETISRAITIIGTQDLRNLVLATTAVKTFTNIPSELIDMTSFWRHSVYCGLVARALSAKCNVLHGERLFVAGLLHDVGKLIICHKLPEMARHALLVAEEDNATLCQVERELMGFDHAQVGGELMRAWKLPPSLQEAVEFHHQPRAAQNHDLEAALVHIANFAANMVEIASSIEERMPGVDPAAWQITGLSEADIEPAVREADNRFSEVLELILPRAYLMY